MALLINVLTQKFELLSCMANSESGEAMDVYNIVQDKAYLILESCICMYVPSSFHRRTKVDQPYDMLYSYQKSTSFFLSLLSILKVKFRKG